MTDNEKGFLLQSCLRRNEKKQKNVSSVYPYLYGNGHDAVCHIVSCNLRDAGKCARRHYDHDNTESGKYCNCIFLGNLSVLHKLVFDAEKKKGIRTLQYAWNEQRQHLPDSYMGDVHYLHCFGDNRACMRHRLFKTCGAHASESLGG